LWFPDDSIRPDRPAEAPINEGAGRGANLFVMLHLENGEALPLVVDTGAPFTVLDRSLEPKLGKRLGTAKHRVLVSWDRRTDQSLVSGTFAGTPRRTIGEASFHIAMTFNLSSLMYLGRTSVGLPINESSPTNAVPAIGRDQELKAATPALSGSTR